MVWGWIRINIQIQMAYSFKLKILASNIKRVLIPTNLNLEFSKQQSIYDRTMLEITMILIETIHLSVIPVFVVLRSS